MTTSYVLGHTEPEIARLDAQAQAIAPATDILLRAAGIGAGMRVLDLGTGLGHVAFRVAALVGPSGEVVGLDQSAAPLQIAEQRRAEAGLDHVRFVEADARTFVTDEPFDAVVERLVLFHLSDAVSVIRRCAALLRPGGQFVALDYDVGACRTEPATELVTRALSWIEAGFRSAAAQPRIGARLALLLEDAGLADVSAFGVQVYVPPGPFGPAMVAGVLRSLAPQILATGIATEDELGLDTLEARLVAEVTGADAVVVMPTVAGAWGCLPLD